MFLCTHYTDKGSHDQTPLIRLDLSHQKEASTKTEDSISGGLHNAVVELATAATRDVLKDIRSAAGDGTEGERVLTEQQWLHFIFIYQAHLSKAHSITQEHTAYSLTNKGIPGKSDFFYHRAPPQSLFVINICVLNSHLVLKYTLQCNLDTSGVFPGSQSVSGLDITHPHLGDPATSDLALTCVQIAHSAMPPPPQPESK